MPGSTGSRSALADPDATQSAILREALARRNLAAGLARPTAGF